MKTTYRLLATLHMRNEATAEIAAFPWDELPRLLAALGSPLSLENASIVESTLAGVHSVCATRSVLAEHGDHNSKRPIVQEVCTEVVRLTGKYLSFIDSQYTT